MRTAALILVLVLVFLVVATVTDAAEIYKTALVGRVLFGTGVCGITLGCNTYTSNPGTCGVDYTCNVADPDASCALKNPFCKCVDRCAEGPLCTRRYTGTVMGIPCLTMTPEQSRDIYIERGLVASPVPAPCSTLFEGGRCPASSPSCVRRHVTSTVVYNGAAVSVPAGTDVCCPAGYIGDTCSTFVGCAGGGGCLNGGTCLASSNQCASCNAGWTGRMCDVPCTSPSQHGCIQPVTTRNATFNGLVYGPDVCGITRDCWAQPLDTPAPAPTCSGSDAWCPSPGGCVVQSTPTHLQLFNASGTLHVVRPGPICCPRGYGGDDCTVWVGCTKGRGCSNGGMCLNPTGDPRDSTCVQCRSGFTGPWCDQPCPECDVPQCLPFKTIGNVTYGPGVCGITADCVTSSSGFVTGAADGCTITPPSFVPSCPAGMWNITQTYSPPRLVHFGQGVLRYIPARVVCCPIGWIGDDCEKWTGCTLTGCAHGGSCLLTDKSNVKLAPRDTRCFGCDAGFNGTAGWGGPLCLDRNEPTFILTSVALNLSGNTRPSRRLLSTAEDELVRASAARASVSSGLIYKEPSRVCDCGVSWEAQSPDSVVTSPMMLMGNYPSFPSELVLLSPIRYTNIPTTDMAPVYWRDVKSHADARYYCYRDWASGGYYFKSAPTSDGVIGRVACWASAGVGRVMQGVARTWGPTPSSGETGIVRYHIRRVLDSAACPDATLNPEWYCAEYPAQCESIRTQGGVGNIRISPVNATVDTLASLHFHLFGHLVRNKPNANCDLTTNLAEDETGCVNVLRAPKALAPLPPSSPLPCANASLIDPDRVAFRTPLRFGSTGFNISDGGDQRCACFPPFRATDESLDTDCAYDLCGLVGGRGLINATYANALDNMAHFNHSDPKACICLGNWGTDPASCSKGSACNWCSATACQNGGTVNATDYSAPCQCLPIFTGDRCQVSLCNASRSYPFDYSMGVPPGKVAESVACDCKPGWTGQLCNDEQCVHGHFNYQKGHCECLAGWVGETCEEAFCEPSHGFLNLSSETCQCTSPWIGERCREHTCDTYNAALAIPGWSGQRPFGEPIVSTGNTSWECGCNWPFIPRLVPFAFFANGSVNIEASVNGTTHGRPLNCAAYDCNYGTPNANASKVVHPADACTCVDPFQIGILTDPQQCTGFSHEECSNPCRRATCGLQQDDIERIGGYVPVGNSASCCMCPAGAGYHIAGECQPWCNFFQPCLFTNTSSFKPNPDYNATLAAERSGDIILQFDYANPNISRVADEENKQWLCECSSQYSSTSSKLNDCSLYTPLVRDNKTELLDSDRGPGEYVPPPPGNPSSSISSSDSSTPSTKLSTGAIVGITIGSVLVAAYFFYQGYIWYQGQIQSKVMAEPVVPNRVTTTTTKTTTTITTVDGRTATKFGHRTNRMSTRPVRLLGLLALMCMSTFTYGAPFAYPNTMLWSAPSSTPCGPDDGTVNSRPQVQFSLPTSITGTLTDLGGQPYTQTYTLRPITFPPGTGQIPGRWPYGTFDLYAYGQDVSPVLPYRTALSTSSVFETTEEIWTVIPLTSGGGNLETLKSLRPPEALLVQIGEARVPIWYLTWSAIATGPWDPPQGSKSIVFRKTHTSFALNLCTAMTGTERACLNGACIAVRGLSTTTTAGFRTCAAEGTVKEYDSSRMLEKNTYFERFTVRGCRCADGFHGLRCELTCPMQYNTSKAVRYSDHDLCSGHGVCDSNTAFTDASHRTCMCKPMVGSSPYCRCDSGYTGDRCEIAVQTKLPVLPGAVTLNQPHANVTFNSMAIISDFSICCPFNSPDCTPQSMYSGRPGCVGSSCVRTVTPTVPCSSPRLDELGRQICSLPQAGTDATLLFQHDPAPRMCGEDEPQSVSVGANGRGLCVTGAGLGLPENKALCGCNMDFNTTLASGQIVSVRRRGWHGDHCQYRTCTRRADQVVVPGPTGSKVSVTLSPVELPCSGHSHGSYSGVSLNYADDTMPCDDTIKRNIATGAVWNVNSEGRCKLCADGWGLYGGYSPQNMTAAGYDTRELGLCSIETFHTNAGLPCGGYGIPTSEMVDVEGRNGGIFRIPRVSACLCPSEWKLTQPAANGGICQRSCAGSAEAVAVPIEFAGQGFYDGTSSRTFNGTISVKCGGYAQGLCRPIGADGFNSACFCAAGFNGPQCDKVEKMWWKNQVCGSDGQAVMSLPPSGAPRLSPWDDEDWFKRYIAPLQGSDIATSQLYSAYKCECKPAALALHYELNTNGICGLSCRSPSLVGIDGTSCSGNGQCIDDPRTGADATPGKLCRCNIGWGGPNCGDRILHDLLDQPCGGLDRGRIVYTDDTKLVQRCECTSNYTANSHAIGTQVYGVCWKNCSIGANGQVCSGKAQGVCSLDQRTGNDNVCECQQYAFRGCACETKLVAAYSLQSGSLLPCTGHGIPDEKGTGLCICDENWAGFACEMSTLNRQCGFGQSYLDSESVGIVVA